jgi:alkyldihydroxyacetonephosphate synthase
VAPASPAEPLARPRDPYLDGSWSGWGDPRLVPALPERLLAVLRDGLGVSGGSAAPAITEISPPPIRLDDATVTVLSRAIGEHAVRADAESRIRHTRGKSTPDLLRLRSGDARDAPDLVLVPASHEEVLELLRICSERRIAVVPFGGGSSVVGGLTPDVGELAGVVAIDLRRMNALVALDEVSRIARLEPGLRGPQAEALLGERGYTIGHFPQSFEYATLGGFAAARSSGQASAGYGRFDELVVRLRVATPAGTLELGRAPKSAAGPDLRQLILGSEGAFGVITELGIHVRPAPSVRRYEGWRFRSFTEGAAALRTLAQDGPRPTVLRLSDEAESALNLVHPDELGAGSPAGCAAVVGYEGSEEFVAHVADSAHPVLGDAGGEPDPASGEHWERERFRGPYLRDALLDAGALVETLETATFWSNVMELYKAVGTALRESLAAQGTPPVVLCHISHVYPTGASLYFTVGCAQLADPVRQWQLAKAAATEAILSAGGSITHHHGVGRDHLDGYYREIGPLALEALRAVKRTLDPAGILNPGILLGPPR